MAEKQNLHDILCDFYKQHFSKITHDSEKVKVTAEDVEENTFTNSYCDN